MANISKKKGVQYSLTQGDGILYNKRPTNGITKATLHNTTYDVVDIIERTGVPIGVLDTTRYELKPLYSATTSCLATEEEMPTYRIPFLSSKVWVNEAICGPTTSCQRSGSLPSASLRATKGRSKNSRRISPTSIGSVRLIVL